MLSSDLARTLQTAELAGLAATPDPAWREIDIGRWQGLTRAEVHELYPEESIALREGKPVRMGGAESWDDFSVRVAIALSDLMARTPAGSRILVVTHGGSIHSVLGSGLNFSGRGRTWPLERVRNASVTEVILTSERFHLQSYNDARHASPVPSGSDTITLVRHAESAANVSGKWHGRTDGPLSDHGLEQAELFADAHPRVDRVFTSPLQRARRTAEAYTRRHGLTACHEPDLMEIDFGAWEGMTTTEIEENFPDEWKAVFEDFMDIPRGKVGESFADAGRRMERIVAALHRAHPDDQLACFSHGGAIWALVARVIGLSWQAYRSLGLPSNTGVSHVQLTTDGPRLVDYNVPLL